MSLFAVLASGESMTAQIAEDVRRSGARTIAINSTFRIAPWAEILYAADEAWWNHPDNIDARSFAGRKLTVGLVVGVERLRNTGSGGFDHAEGCIRTGGNSGYQGLHLAVQQGAKRVLLCGFDMHGGHWHGDHPRGLQATTCETFERWISRFNAVAPVLMALGVDVVNVSSTSRLECFRKSTLEAELAACAEPAAA